MALIVEIKWHVLRPRNRAWQWSRCLYAYVHPASTEILYLGKADGTTVRQRCNAPDKDAVLNFFAEELNVDHISVLAGAFLLEPDRRLTRELLADVESLLIKRLKPRGNVSATRSRITRPGLEVICTGEWPLRRSHFRDVG